jgi:hypothetical protein
VIIGFFSLEFQYRCLPVAGAPSVGSYYPVTSDQIDAATEHQWQQLVSLGIDRSLANTGKQIP